MRKIIENWFHMPGKHCASTALSDLSHFYGKNYTESLAFGIGSGLGFFYVKGDFLSPSRAIYTRSLNLEKNFFENQGIPFNWLQEDDPDIAMEKAKEYINRNVPLLLQTDLYYIDYYNSSTHFNGHIVVMWGYDDERKVAFLTDTHWEGLKELSYTSLKNARNSQIPPFPLKNNFFPVENMDFKIEFHNALKIALIQQAKYMIEGGELPEYSGIKGMRRVAQELGEWIKREDASWCFRFAYQVIERRGTGGGAFRFLYADFLKICEEELSRLRKIEPYQRMRKIAENWSKLGSILKEGSEGNTSSISKGAEILSEIADDEENLFSDILNQLSA